MKTLWTFPGKIGDTLLTLPIAIHWALKHGEKIDIHISEHVEPIGNLIAAQSVVESVKVATGRITSLHCGGQPWHFDYKDEDTAGYDRVFHTGFRKFPDQQITLFTRDALELKDEQPDELFQHAAVLPPNQVEPVNRLVLHARRISQGGGDPYFFRLVRRLLDSGLADRFNEVVAVGTREERLDARSRLRVKLAWADNGDWSALASYLANSACVIDAGSGVAALAGAVGTPCVRVHDPIYQFPKTIWSNPQRNQINFAEADDPKELDEFFDKWVPVGYGV